MRFSHALIERPVFAIVLSIVLVLVGAIAYLGLPVAQYPEVAPPTIQIKASYPGADAATVGSTVATPIEQEINGVDNMLYMSSYSTGDGNMTLTITFKLGTNLDVAQVLVQNRVAIAAPRLPEPVQRLGVTVLKSSPDLMLVVHLTSPDDAFDQLYMSNYARNNIREELLRLDGVGDVNILGERQYSIRLWLDPDKLAAMGMTSGDVVKAVQEQNVEVSGGALGQEPIAKSAAFALTITTQGRLESPREFGKIVVRNTSDGRLVRVEDVARVELGAQDYLTNSFLDDKSAVAMLMFQRPGTNALDTARQILAKMKELKENFPPGLDYTVVYNPTDFIAESVREVYKTLGEALVLVVLVVIVFLQSWRTALIPVLAIPVSLVGTFAVMSALGFSLNTLTLFGLVLAIGIVVDDAIVVIENVERNIEAGLRPRQAAHRTIDEVGSAVVAIALVLVAVFVPTAFIPGVAGQFYRQFALTIAVSTVISAFVSLTLTPALAAMLLRSRPHPGLRKRGIARVFGTLAGGFNAGFDRLSDGYARSVGVFVRRKAIMLPIYGGLLAATVWTTGHVPQGFIPLLDQGYVIVVAQLPDGASLGRTDAVTHEISRIAMKTPGALHAVAFSGLAGATFTNATNAATVFIKLAPAEERVANGLTADKVIKDLTGRLAQIQEAFILVIPPPPVRGLSELGGFKLQVEERQGADVRRVTAATYDLMAKARQDGRLAGVFTGFSDSFPQLYLKIDRQKAQMLNVPISNIFETLQDNLGAAYVNDFNAFGRVYQVRAEADQRFRVSQENVDNLKVRSSNGALVPLGTLVDIQEVGGPYLVQHYDIYTSVPLQGGPSPTASSGQALDAMEQLAKETLPAGIKGEWTELAFLQRNAGGNPAFIFALSVLFVFLVLAAQYESWTLPLAIILIVPMCVLSAFAGVIIRGMDDNVLTQIGLVVLVGLAAKNAILIVEFARGAEAAGGKDPVAAVVEACRLRLRPILMTAFAFILGVLPLAIAVGPGAELRQALGTAVFAGMIGVTLFGLLLTPVFYVSIRLLALRFGRKDDPDDESTPGTVAQGGVGR